MLFPCIACCSTHLHPLPGRPCQAVPAGEHSRSPCICSQQQRKCTHSGSSSSRPRLQQLAGPCLCSILQGPRGPQPQGGTNHKVWPRFVLHTVQTLSGRGIRSAREWVGPAQNGCQPARVGHQRMHLCCWLGGVLRWGTGRVTRYGVVGQG